MNSINVINAGKNFYRSWLYKDINLTINASPGNSYAILGNNGSGKSTFLLMLTGQTSPTQGKINWIETGVELAENQWHLHYAISSPGMELPEELNLMEWYAFIQKVKPLKKDISLESIAELCKFTRKTLQKPIGNFSSGMKQRVKLCGNLLSNVPVSFLDEPLSNLDTDGIALYHSLIEMEKYSKALIVASNDPKEYESISNRFRIEDKQLIQL
jgi:ABC-type multidrug transport system ATPase subunit